MNYVTVQKKRTRDALQKGTSATFRLNTKHNKLPRSGIAVISSVTLHFELQTCDRWSVESTCSTFITSHPRLHVAYSRRSVICGDRLHDCKEVEQNKYCLRVLSKASVQHRQSCRLLRVCCNHWGHCGQFDR